jgi:hypothetical protein
MNVGLSVVCVGFCDDEGIIAIYTNVEPGEEIHEIPLTYGLKLKNVVNIGKSGRYLLPLLSV